MLGKMVNPENLPCELCSSTAEYNFSNLSAPERIDVFCGKHAQEVFNLPEAYVETYDRVLPANLKEAV